MNTLQKELTDNAELLLEFYSEAAATPHIHNVGVSYAPETELWTTSINAIQFCHRPTLKNALDDALDWIEKYF